MNNLEPRTIIMIFVLISLAIVGFSLAVLYKSEDVFERKTRRRRMMKEKQARREREQRIARTSLSLLGGNNSDAGYNEDYSRMFDPFGLDRSGK
jgi:CRP-like cAMP-binding protein